MWIQTGVTVRKRLIWVVTSVTLTFDLWPWPFAWTSLLSLVITPENFMMIRWWEHIQKGETDGRTDGRTDRRTDGRTDGQTDWTIQRAAWSQLKIKSYDIIYHHHVSRSYVALTVTSIGLTQNTRDQQKTIANLHDEVIYRRSDQSRVQVCSHGGRRAHNNARVLTDSSGSRLTRWTPDKMVAILYATYSNAF